MKLTPWILAAGIAAAPFARASGAEVSARGPVDQFAPIERVETGVYSPKMFQVKKSQEAAPTHTAKQIKELFSKKIMPGVNKGLEAMGGSTNESRCDTGSAMVAHGLSKLGVKGAKIREGDGHVFVEVKTKDNKTLILDPTMGQFVRDGTKLDSEVRKNGWAGTKEQLTDMIHNNKKDFHFNPNFEMIQSDIRTRYSSGAGKEVHDAIVHGKKTNLHPSDVKAMKPQVEEYRQSLVGQHHYPKNPKERFAPTARASLKWWQEGGQGARMVVAEKGKPPIDKSATYRAGFEALEQALK